MRKKKTLKPVFTEKHKEYMRRARKAEISVAEGAVRAGKTVDNVAVFAWLIDAGVPDRIHLATGSTLANAKLNIGDCNGFGLEYIFRGRCKWTKYKGNDALAITNKNHKKYIVIFAGGGKADSYKKIRGNSYGMWIATEINLHHPSMIKEAFDRQLAAKVRKILWDLNPSSPANFIYKDHIDTFERAFGADYNYAHFTIRDNATITQERLAKIEAQYDPNSIWYKRDILGERCNAEGLIYDMFNEDCICDDISDTDGAIYISSDYGIQNATTFLFWRQVRGTSNWKQIGEYYYSGREQHKQKTVRELVDDLFDCYAGVRNALGYDVPIAKAIVDPSASALKVELHKRGIRTQDANNDVRNGIADTGSALRRGIIKIYRSCTNTIAEFGIYTWDEKASEEGEDEPIKANDHCMDAVRYFVKTHNLVIREDKASSSRRKSILA